MTMEGKNVYVKVISMSITKAVEWVCAHEGISAEQIMYANGEEAEVA